MKNFFSLFSLLLVVSLTSCQKYSGTCTITAGENGDIFVAVDNITPKAINNFKESAYKIGDCKCQDDIHRSFWIAKGSGLHTSLLNEKNEWIGTYTFTVADDKITGVKSHDSSYSSHHETNGNGNKTDNSRKSKVYTGKTTLDEDGNHVITIP